MIFEEKCKGVSKAILLNILPGFGFGSFYQGDEDWAILFSAFDLASVGIYASIQIIVMSSQNPT